MHKSYLHAIHKCVGSALISTQHLKVPYNCELCLYTYRISNELRNVIQLESLKQIKETTNNIFNMDVVCLYKCLKYCHFNQCE